MILIGLDPGKETGFAVWDCTAFRFTGVDSRPIHRAMGEVLKLYRHEVTPVLVVWEDARLRNWGFTKMDNAVEKYGAGAREGAGAAKRDATIWADFLEDHRIPNIPKKPHKTKRGAEEFNRMAGGKFRTNEHSRDAGFLVLQINMPTAYGMLRTYQASRQKVS